MYLIIFGPPGAGKGTQSVLIAQKLGIKHLSTGEILRQAVDEKTPLGLKAKQIMDAGDLVSDEIMIGIIQEAISAPDAKDGFILDGFPRTIKQAEELDKIMHLLGYGLPKVINIIVDDNELIKRMLGRGRNDDTAEAIQNRLNVYKQQTAPVKEHYLKKSAVFDIIGKGSIQDINEQIIKILQN